jgi:hypothetical protein
MNFEGPKIWQLAKKKIAAMGAILHEPPEKDGTNEC